MNKQAFKKALPGAVSTSIKGRPLRAGMVMAAREGCGADGHFSLFNSAR